VVAYSPYRLRMGRGRRVQIAVVLALIALGVGNAGMHMQPIGAAILAVLVALAAWFITGAVNDRRD
jgi:hypothetical protein